MKGKHATIASTLLAVLLPLLPGRAQEVPYALPSTTILVQVEVEQQQFYAGPYAAFAKKMLNIDVRQEDEVSCSLVSARLVPVVEADAEAWYSCDLENSSLMSLNAQGLVSLGNTGAPVQWRFPAPDKADFSYTGFAEDKKTVTRVEFRSEITEEGDTLRVPIEHKLLVDKTFEEKAAEAASKVISLRLSRLNIASGDTDASFSGEALPAALKELEQAQNEYLSLFRGYTVKRRFTATFEIIPRRDDKILRYLAFRLTDNGPVADGSKGVPFYLELEPEASEGLQGDTPDRKKARVIYYRIPAICKVSLTQDGKVLLQSRLPVYQFGRESIYPVNK